MVKKVLIKVIPFLTQKNSPLKVCLLLGILFGVLIWRGCSDYLTHKKNEYNREALVKMHQELEFGQRAEEIKAVYEKYKTEDLNLEMSQKGAYISMPLEIGAMDWNLMVDFSGGKITKVWIRTSDGPKPKDSSPDKLNK